MNNTNEDLTRLARELKTRERRLVGVESGVYLAVILTAFLGNTLLITAVYKTSMIRNRQNYYLVSLAATDILSAVVYMPFTLAVLIQGERPFGEFFCQLQGSVLAVSGGVSMLTLGMIAFNRYVKISRSVTLYRKIFSKQNVLISIAISWIATVVLIVVAFSLSKAVFYYHPGKSLCWLQISLANKVSLYCLGVYSLWIFIATTTIAFCYYKIFRKVHEHFAQVANSSVHNDNSAAFNEEVKISTMLFIIILAFFICWSPAVVIEFCDFFGGYYTLPRQVYLINVYTYSFISAVNPFIYGFMKREFKEAYKKVLCCREH